MARIIPDHYRSQFYLDASHPRAKSEQLRKVRADIERRLKKKGGK